MSYGGNVKSDEISAHKRMAGAASKGNLGVGSYPPGAGKSQPSRSNTLPDGAKGPGIGARGVMAPGKADRITMGEKY